MKKALVILICICLFFSGCKTKEQPVKEVKKLEEFKGMWITYSELASFSNSADGLAASFTKAVERAKTLGINTVFVHTRAFCDSIYQSEYFPFANYILPSDTDVLKTMIDICHQNDIKFHAWINPYRVSTASNDINTLPDDSPAKKWLTDDDADNDKNVCFTENGIYLNPAECDSKRLILDGVREILKNYDVDGIHIDDYFYPTTVEEFDKASYEIYATGLSLPMTLSEWRRKNVSSLINSIYCTIKTYGKGVEFGISPAADLDRCYNQLYADVEGWIGGGYIDYVIPQLYFGFEYPQEEFCFENLIVKWLDITNGKDVKLYCGLGCYKIGTDAEPDNIEWNKYDDIIARQIRMLRRYKVSGYAFFSYTSLFSENLLNKKQLENIKKE